MAPRGTVLFINKSAKSKTLTRSEGAEKRDIYSHVQQLPVSKTSETAIVLRWEEVLAAAASTTTNGKANYSSRREDDKDGSRIRPKKAKTGREVQSIEDFEQTISRLLERVFISAVALNASQIDPFDCGAVPLDQRITFILKAFCSSVTSKIYTVKSWAHASLRRILPHASAAPELLYALLCSTSGEMYTKSSDQTHAYNSIYFKGLAINHLQRSIDDRRKAAEGPSIATLRAVCTLVYLECQHSNLPTARQHYAALRTLLSLHPDITQTPLAMRTSLVVPSFFCAAMLGEEPLDIDISTGWKDDETDAYATELLTRFDNRILVNGRPSRFENPAAQAMMGPELVAVVEKMHGIEGFSPTSPSPHPSCPQERFASRIELAHTLSPKPTTLISLSPCQTAVRTALYLTLAPLNAAYNVSVPFKRTLAAGFRPALVNAQGMDLMEVWFPCWDFLLWVFCVSAWVFEDDGEFEQVAMQAMRLVSALGITSREQLEGLLKEFVWPERMFTSTLERLWTIMSSQP